jgi:hypothetical protein
MKSPQHPCYERFPWNSFSIKLPEFISPFDASHYIYIVEYTCLLFSIRVMLMAMPFIQHFLVPTQLTTAFSMQEDDVHIYLSIIYYCLATIWPPFKTTIKIKNWRVHWSQSNNKQTRLLQQTKWRYDVMMKESYIF